MNENTEVQTTSTSHHVEPRQEDFIQNLLPRDSSVVAQNITHAQMVALSGYFAGDDPASAKVRMAQAFVRIQKGYELGIGPISSIENIYAIRGEGICLGVHLLTALIRSSGGSFTIRELTDKSCKIQFFYDKEKTDVAGDASWTIEQARRAGLLNRKGWQKYPEDYLFARAVVRGFRRYFSDLSMGMVYIPDEMGMEMGEERLEPVEIDTTNEIKTIEESLMNGDDYPTDEAPKDFVDLVESQPNVTPYKIVEHPPEDVPDPEEVEPEIEESEPAKTVSKDEFITAMNEVLPFDDKRQLEILRLITGNTYNDLSSVLPKARKTVLARINQAMTRLGGVNRNIERVQAFFTYCTDNTADLSTARLMQDWEKAFKAQEKDD